MTENNTTQQNFMRDNKTSAYNKQQKTPRNQANYIPEEARKTRAK